MQRVETNLVRAKAAAIRLLIRVRGSPGPSSMPLNSKKPLGHRAVFLCPQRNASVTDDLHRYWRVYKLRQAMEVDWRAHVQASTFANLSTQSQIPHPSSDAARRVPAWRSRHADGRTHEFRPASHPATRLFRQGFDLGRTWPISRTRVSNTSEEKATHSCSSPLMTREYLTSSGIGSARATSHRL